MEFIGLLLKSSSGDSILLSNGDIPILQRKGETIVVDDSKLELIGHFPFECLNIRYEKGRLVQI